MKTDTGVRRLNQEVVERLSELFAI